MPLSPNFTSVELSNLSSVLVTDTSTGSDGGIVARRIFFQEYNGSYLVPSGTLTDYVPFPLGGSTITIDNLLLKAWALNVRVDWVDTNGNALYSLTILNGYPSYIKYGLYQLSQYQIPNNNLLKVRNYRQAKLDVWDAVISGDNAISQGSDITNAQRCYDAATAILSNPSNFY
jgi:hypothetical protein